MTAVVTGASSGIGRDIARELAARGIDLVLVARRRDRLEELARELPVTVRIIEADLGDESVCRDVYDQLKDAQVDILINNAGFGLFGEFDKTDLARELEMINVNVRAVHILTKLFLCDFNKRDSGYILNVASIAAFLPGPMMATYYASKAYVLRLTQAVREELRRAGSHVHIAALCPGPVPTEFNRTAQTTFVVRGTESRRIAAIAVSRLLRGRSLILPTILEKGAKWGLHLLPDACAARIAGHMQWRRSQEKTK